MLYINILAGEAQYPYSNGMLVAMATWHFVNFDMEKLAELCTYINYEGL